MGRARGASRPAGAALHVVMAVVAVLLLLAASMVALSTMNLNMTTSYHNGQVAQNEAEAAISKLLYAISDREHFGLYETEEIRGTVTSGYSGDQCYHYLTFRRDRKFPYSVNNIDRSKPKGYMGRTVPPRMVHAFATGYCRGQYRTIEVLLEKPEFPYALGTSGRIHAPGPIVVQGTSSAGSYKSGETTRPGHVISNSTSQDVNNPAIYIGKDGTNPTNQTLISGFVQAAGLVKILDPATISGGVRPMTDPQKLPDISIQGYRNAGEPGVIEISPASLEGQTLDVMYHCSHDLTYTGGVSLENAFLYVQGNLTIQGSLKGVGAVVADGNVTVVGDTELEANSCVALMASGDLTLQGQGNFFQGLLYSRGNLNARNITVLGNAIVNAPNTSQGNSTLDKVHFVTNAQASTLKFTSTSSTDARQQGSGGTTVRDVPFSLGGYGWDVDNPDPSKRDNTSAPPRDTFFTLEPWKPDGHYHGADPNGVTSLLWHWTRDDEVLKRSISLLSVPDLGALRASCPDAGKVFDLLEKAVKDAEDWQKLPPQIEAAEASLAAKQAELNGMSEDDPDRDKVESDIAALESKIAALKAEQKRLEDQYKKDMEAMAKAYYEYYTQHADGDGRYKKDGKTINVKKDFDFDLSRFLPVGDQLKVRYWHVFHGRL